MKVSKTIEIKRSADEVWQVLGRDFASADAWMAAAEKTYPKRELDVRGQMVPGRICELTNEPDGFFADETITLMDDDTRRLETTVVPRNGPALLPFVENRVAIEVVAIDAERSEVRWTSEPALKAHGYLMYPLMKLGLGKAFVEVLEELKTFVETGEPHPRKRAKLAA